MDGEQVYADLLKPVIQEKLGQQQVCPALIQILAGDFDGTMVMIANRALVHWQLGLKMVKPGPGGCPWYAPTTQSVDYRTFFGRMRKDYGWKLNEGHFKGCQGFITHINDGFISFKTGLNCLNVATLLISTGTPNNCYTTGPNDYSVSVVITC